MAEAATVVNNTSTRYFCHKCSDEINPLPEFICPRCRSGFIEELETPRPTQVPRTDSNDSNRVEWLDSRGHPLAELMSIYDFDSNRSQQSSGPAPSTSQHGPMTGSFVQLSESSPHPLEAILQRLLTSVVTGRESEGPRPFGALASIGVDIPIPFLQVLHGNPGDYAWGAGGLDAVISQLLNNLDSSGPPPMAKTDIQNLPYVSVTRDQVEKNLQCSVCMEDFKLEEQVKQVPCGHIYHGGCIVPWLEMHGTCPICRKVFNSTSGATDSTAASTNTATNSTSNPSSTSSQASSSFVSGLHYEDLNEYD